MIGFRRASPTQSLNDSQASETLLAHPKETWREDHRLTASTNLGEEVEVEDIGPWPKGSVRAAERRDREVRMSTAVRRKPARGQVFCSSRSNS